MPKMPNTSDGFVSSISEPNSPVKLKIKDVTESRQTGAKGSGNIPSLVTQPAGKIKVSDLFSYVKKSATKTAEKYLREPADWRRRIYL